MVAVRKLSAASFAQRICGGHTYGGFSFYHNSYQYDL